MFEGRLSWVALALAAACSAEHHGPDHVAAEQSDGAANVPADSGAAVPDSSRQALAEAGQNGPAVDVCSSGVPRAGHTEYTLELPELCSMLAHDGRVACPANRRALIDSRVDCTPDRTSFPLLRRHCGTDLFYELYSYEPFLHLTWTFAAESGQLLGAVVAGVGEAFPCGRGTYMAGPPFDVCEVGDVYCRLCESGADRDAECPDDVVRALPGKVCEIPAVAPGCKCENPGGSFTDLAREGAPCGAPSTCPNCTSGTCWTSCVCALDGTFRWDLECAE
jgi:hypothetical protein